MAKRRLNLNSPWFVTLISTIIGIIAGLYITNSFEKNKQYKAKEKALTLVKEELKDNMEMLKNFNEQLTSKYEPASYVFASINENQELVIPKDSLEVFKHKTALVFTFKKAEPISDTHVKLKGEFNSIFNTKLMSEKLSNIIWSSYKQTDYLAITSFKCLTDIETFYALQSEVNLQMGKWKAHLYEGDFIESPEGAAAYMNTWKSLLIKQKLLLDYYEFLDDVLLNCK